MRNVGLLGWRLLIRAQPLESRGETLDIWGSGRRRRPRWKRRQLFCSVGRARRLPRRRRRVVPGLIALERVLVAHCAAESRASGRASHGPRGSNVAAMLSLGCGARDSVKGPLGELKDGVSGTSDSNLIIRPRACLRQDHERARSGSGALVALWQLLGARIRQDRTPFAHLLRGGQSALQVERDAPAAIPRVDPVACEAERAVAHRPLAVVAPASRVTQRRGRVAGKSGCSPASARVLHPFRQAGCQHSKKACSR